MTTGSADPLNVVLVPAPRVRTFTAQAVPPPPIEVHPNNLTTTFKEDGDSFQLKLEVVWNPVPTEFELVRYQLRIVKQETYRERADIFYNDTRFVRHSHNTYHIIDDALSCLISTYRVIRRLQFRQLFQ